MPDAAKLVAALCIGLVGIVLSSMIVAVMPPSNNFSNFTVINAVIGACIGWIVMGKRAGYGTVSAINNGLTGMASFVVWVILIHSAWVMIKLAMRHRYDTAAEALVAIFELSAEMGVAMLTLPIIATVMFASVIAGLATEYAYAKWH